MQEKLSSFNYKRDLYDLIKENKSFSREKKEDILKKCLQAKILFLYNEKREMINVKSLQNETLSICLKLAFYAIGENSHNVFCITSKKTIPSLKEKTDNLNQNICYQNYRKNFWQ